MTKPGNESQKSWLMKTCWMVLIAIAALASIVLLGYFSQPAPIFIACHEGNVTRVDELLAEFVANDGKVDTGRVAELVDSWGNSIVHWAARGGSIDVLTFLVEEHGLNPINLRNKRGSNVLHWAALAPPGTSDGVTELLVKWGVPMNDVNNDNETALHWAVLWEKPKMVSKLIDAGADPNAKDVTGASPMHLVNLGPCRQSHEEDSDLMSKTAGPECVLSATILETLLEHGGDVHQKDEQGRSFYDSVVSHLTRQSKESGGQLEKLMEKLQSGSIHDEQGWEGEESE